MYDLNHKELLKQVIENKRLEGSVNLDYRELFVNSQIEISQLKDIIKNLSLK